MGQVEPRDRPQHALPARLGRHADHGEPATPPPALFRRPPSSAARPLPPPVSSPALTPPLSPSPCSPFQEHCLVGIKGTVRRNYDGRTDTRTRTLPLHPHPPRAPPPTLPRAPADTHALATFSSASSISPESAGAHPCSSVESTRPPCQAHHPRQCRHGRDAERGAAYLHISPHISAYLPISPHISRDAERGAAANHLGGAAARLPGSLSELSSVGAPLAGPPRGGPL